ncbi:MAG: tripartite tricarboxylate transporter TctB family protein [Deltaproteobacteria bacterium]|nr:tripartite tricarboxylate transporter TctB family protein [Deltaproteobacteria bacterium]
MVRRDVVVAALALAFGVTAIYESAKLPFGTTHNPGPGFFPWWTSVVLALLALVLLAQALMSGSSAAREGPGRIAKVAALLVVLAAYTFLLDPLGYPLCTFLFVLFMLRATDPQRWAVALGMAAITAYGSYVLFAIWLNVPLPRGPL